MTTVSLRITHAAVQAWVRIYTWRMPPELRDRRRSEVDSDLWENAHDPVAPHSAFQVTARLLGGLTDDLAWRFEQENIMHRFMTWRTAAIVLGGALIVLATLVSQRLTPRAPSPYLPPPTVRAGLTGSANVPPPPPPPPPPPEGWTAGKDIARGRATQYGDTSFTVAPGAPAPVKVKDVRPVYPPIAAAYELGGAVILEATVDERGRVSQTSIVRSIPVFDQAAIHAVRQWEFQPAAVNGTPVRAVITVTARFGGAR